MIPRRFNFILALILVCIFTAKSFFRPYRALPTHNPSIQSYLNVIHNHISMSFGDRWKSSTVSKTAFSSSSTKYASSNYASLNPKQISKVDKKLIEARNMEKERVERLEVERVNLTELTVGQKRRGRVISFTEFGMFVDVGTTKPRDGLVHVKDMSRDYFVHDHEKKYVPGQDLDTWVKFVEPENKKLGLQLYPIVDMIQKHAEIGIEKIDITKLKIGDAVKGVVVRTSDYGVYVNIGANADAFLQKRKMKIGKKRIPLRTWEIYPCGSVVNAYVYDIQRDRNRIALTTFDPMEWEDKIPSKQEDDGSDDNDEGGEELGSSTRAANSRAMKRILDIDEDGDKDDEEDGEDDDLGLVDDNDDDSYEIVEDLSQDELDKILKQRQLINDDPIDDTLHDDSQIINTKPSSSSSLSKKSSSMHDDHHDDVDDDVMLSAADKETMSTDELFRTLSRGRDYVTMTDVKRWDYVKDAIHDVVITEDELKVMFREACGRGAAGRLSEERFDIFVDIFADRLGLEDDVNSMIDDDNDVNQDGDRDMKPSVVIMDDTVSMPTSPSFEKHDDTDDEDNYDDIEALSSRDKNDDTYDDADDDDIDPISSHDKDDDDKDKDDMSIEQLYEKNPTTDDIFDYVFKSVAGTKSYISLDDVMRWDFVQAMIASDAINSKQAEMLFRACITSNRRGPPGQPKLVDVLDKSGFEVFVDKLSNREISLSKASSSQSSSSVASSMKKVAVDDIEAIHHDDDEDDHDDGHDDNDDDGDYLDIEATFRELCDGKKMVSYEAVLAWDVVQGMMDDDLLTSDDLRTYFIQAGATSSASSASSSKVKKAAGKAKGAKVSAKDKDKLSLDFAGFEALLDILAPLAEDEGDDYDEVYDMGDDIDNDDMDVSDMIQDAYDNDDGDDEMITMNDTGLSSSRHQSMARRENHSIAKPASSSISTDFVPMKNLYLDPKPSLITSASSSYTSAVKTSKPASSTSSLSPSSSSTSLTAPPTAVEFESSTYDDSNVDDDAQLLEAVFQSLSKGKTYVTVKDLLDWDFILELLTEDMIDEFRGSSKDKGLSLQSFDQFVDDLVAAYKVHLDSLQEEVDKDMTSSESDTDDKDYYDIDTEVEFRKLAAGRDHITYDDIKQWSLIKELTADQHDSNDMMLRECLDRANINNTHHINMADFEAFVEELTGDDEDMDDDGVGNEEYF